MEETAHAGVQTVLFDKIQANPLESMVMAEAKAARDNGCDFIVALGGGSVMDVSRMIAQALGTEDTGKPRNFITALAELQKLCSVDDLKMSDSGFGADEMNKIAVNARETMGGLFLAAPCELDHDGYVDILKKSYGNSDSINFSGSAEPLPGFFPL